MYSITYLLVAIFGFFAIASACPAPENKDSPFASVYTAIFDKGGILGTVTFYSLNGYVNVAVALAGLPRQGGPFMYHIHQKQVPSSGDCQATLGHFNPFCGVLDAKTPAEFEVGDLSGKHGTIRGTSTLQNYEDRYLSLNRNSKSFIGNLSVVIHLANGQRIACANIFNVLSPLTGAQADAAKQSEQLNLPQEVAALLA